MKNMQWIWCHQENNVNEYAEFYGEFFYEAGDAVCNISCDGDYALWINGQFVASNQYGDFEHYKIFDSLALGGYIKKGKNSFAVLVWHFGQSTHRYVDSTAGVCFEVLCDDDKILLKSDENILARQSRAYVSHETRLLSRQLGFTFAYDGTKEDDWKIGKGEGFSPAAIREKHCVFFPRPIEKLRLGKKRSATLLSTGENYAVFDLGEECVGLPYCKLHTSKEQTLKISYGEYLLDGRVKAKFDDCTDFTFDYVAKVGENDYVNYMLRLGCRYLEIVFESPIQVEEIGLIPQYYPAKTLACTIKNETDRDIYEICLRTLKLCMMEHYVDCPWREQGLYTFDARNQMLCGYYAFEGGNYDYARSNLLLMAKDERADGLLSITFPCGTPLTIPAYSLHYIIAVKEYVEHSGDITLAVEVYEKMQSLIDVFLAKRKNGVVYSFAGADKWNFYDWTKYTKGTTGTKEERAELILNVLTLLALRDLEWICQRADLPWKYDGVRESMIKSAREVFFREEDGLFGLTATDKDYTVLGNSLAILSGLATEQESENIAKKLREGKLIDCSLCMRPFLYDALLKVDRQGYSDFVLNTIRKEYGKMLAEGSTTAWETADGYKALAGTGSLCHGWSAIPIYYYHTLDME